MVNDFDTKWGASMARIQSDHLSQPLVHNKAIMN